MYGQIQQWDSLKVDGLIRKFEIYLPAKFKAGAPLWVCLHGYGGYGGMLQQIKEAADCHGIVLCWPVGLTDPTGHSSWNTGYIFQKDWRVDDVKALCKIARYMQKHYQLNPDNTFLTGMSNGGEMSYLMAFSKQDVFRAVAPVAGLTMEWMYKTLQAPKAIPLFEIHGTADMVSCWNGDLQNLGGWGPYLPVPITINYWVARARCTNEIIDTIPSIDSQSKHFIVRHKFKGGINGNEIWLYENVGSNHGWQDWDINIGEALWDFFSKFMSKNFKK